ncbi:MAG TPA: ABC transporter permease, partial [Burkholderiales bacterium]
MRLALRMLARDWRAGELRVLAVALVVAVASITSVAFFADRVGRALVRDAHQLLGADLVLVADQPWPREVAEEIARRGLARAEALNFISMARAGESSTLAGVKAVTEGYPLRGRLRVAPAVGAPDAPAAGGPPRGAVWLEERLVSALGTAPGASLRLGAAELKVDAVLTLEPERGANFFNIAPRLIMNAADLPATDLV